MQKLQATILKNLPIVILAILLIAVGVYSYSLQHKLKQIEHELTTFQNEVAQLTEEIITINSEIDTLTYRVDKIDSELYGKTLFHKTFTPLGGEQSRLDIIEENVIDIYSGIELRIDDLESKVDEIRDTLEREGFYFSPFW